MDRLSLVSLRILGLLLFEIFPAPAAASVLLQARLPASRHPPQARPARSIGGREAGWRFSSLENPLEEQMEDVLGIVGVWTRVHEVW